MSAIKWARPPKTGKIRKDGAYIDLPMSRYHSDCCDGTSTSSGELRRYVNDGPAEVCLTGIQQQLQQMQNQLDQMQQLLEQLTDNRR